MTIAIDAYSNLAEWPVSELGHRAPVNGRRLRSPLQELRAGAGIAALPMSPRRGPAAPLPLRHRSEGLRDLHQFLHRQPVAVAVARAHLYHQSVGLEDQ